MRITVDIPEALYRELKSKAAHEGCSMKEVVMRGIEGEVRRRDTSPGRVKLPLLPSKEPGVLELDNETIYKLIEFP